MNRFQKNRRKVVTFHSLFSRVLSFLPEQAIKSVTHAILSWFESSTTRFQPIVYFVAFLSFIATVILFLTPLFSRDTQVFKIDPNTDGNRPNIILIIVDALSAEDMSLFGYYIDTTPQLERVTQNWSRYANAQSPNNCSVDIYPAIITGRYSSSYCQYSLYGDLIRSSDKWVNLFEILDQAGYETWWTGYKPPGLYHTGAGIDTIFARPNSEVLQTTWIQMDGVRKTYFPYVPLFFYQTAHSLKDYGPSGNKNEIGADLIEQKAMHPPFFLYIHYTGVHGVPYPSGRFLGSILPPEEGLLDRLSQKSIYGEYELQDQSNVDKLRLRYDEAILNQDARLKDIITIIKDAGYYDSSMIIIMGDHGQVFNNGYSSHCTPLVSYSEMHVPLLIKYPYQSKGETIDTVVSTIDLTPTILDVVGIAYQKEWFDGISLLEDSIGHTSNRYVFSGRGCTQEYVAAQNDQYRIIFRGDDTLLFDYRNDPDENNNLFFTLGPESKIVLEAMQALEGFQQLKGSRCEELTGLANVLHTLTCSSPGPEQNAAQPVE